MSTATTSSAAHRMNGVKEILKGKDGIEEKEKVSILKLPLVSNGKRFTERLLPDPLTPTPSSLVAVQDSAPSLLRRSRNVGEGGHFTYTSPLVLNFPYTLESNEEKEDEGKDEEEEKKKVDQMTPEERETYGMEKAKEQMERIERLMRPYEILPEMINKDDQIKDHLEGYLPKGRTSTNYPSARILGYSKECVQDCLPQLDVGDLDEWLVKNAKKDGPDTYTSGSMAQTPSQEDKLAYARYELSDYLSGRLLGMQLPFLEEDEIEQGAERGVAEAQHKMIMRNRESGIEEDVKQRWKRKQSANQKRLQGQPKEYSGYAPWSNAYSGHQFGQWAGQLGDGRAITLMETFNETTKERWEIQLKGAGRTPYSRFADGLAVLFSSVREYLASEAMHGLRIPTSRALCLISLPDITVRRETRNTAAITTRLAPIWVRVGSFEHHATREEWESLRLLGEFTCEVGYGWKDVVGDDAKPWAERLIRECVIRNAKTIALWQTYGFMHGVMNTDNISVLGLTIDYGPYGFMDIFEKTTICNKSDGEGRYAYHMQPTAGMFVMEQLTKSLAAIVGFERKNGRSAKPGELIDLDENEINQLGRNANETLWPEMKELFMDTLIDSWLIAWRKRLGLISSKDDDRYTLIEPLMDLMEGYFDMTHTLRKLTQLPNIISNLDENDSEKVENFVNFWQEWQKGLPSYLQEERKKNATKWVKTYVNRLREERLAEIQSDDIDAQLKEIKKDLQATNPTFILRNWVADEVIKRLQKDDDTEFLQKILHMSLHPFNPWGEEVAGKSEEERKEEERLCSLGTLLTTNMPSCSS